MHLGIEIRCTHFARTPAVQNGIAKSALGRKDSNMRISIEGVVSQLMNQGFKSAVGRRRGADLLRNAKVRILSVSNASHMKVAQKPRGIARFRRYELVSVCGIWQWRRHSCLLSPRAFFGVSFLVPYWVRLSAALWKVRRIQPLSSRLNSLKKRQNPAGTPSAGLRSGRCMAVARRHASKQWASGAAGQLR